MFNLTKETVMRDKATFQYFVMTSVKKQNKVFTLDSILDEFDKLGVDITGYLVEMVKRELGCLITQGMIKKKSSHYTIIK